MRFYILDSFRNIHCQNVPKTFETPCITGLFVGLAVYALIRHSGVIMFYEPVFLLLRHLTSRAFYIYFSIVT